MNRRRLLALLPAIPLLGFRPKPPPRCSVLIRFDGGAWVPVSRDHKLELDFEAIECPAKGRIEIWHRHTGGEPCSLPSLRPA